MNSPWSDPPPAFCWTELTLVTLWNLLIVGRSISFSFAQQDHSTERMKYFDTVGSGNALLIAGAIAIFFGKGTDLGSPTVRPRSVLKQPNRWASARRSNGVGQSSVRRIARLFDV